LPFLVGTPQLGIGDLVPPLEQALLRGTYSDDHYITSKPSSHWLRYEQWMGTRKALAVAGRRWPPQGGAGNARARWLYPPDARQNAARQTLLGSHRRAPGRIPGTALSHLNSRGQTDGSQLRKPPCSDWSYEVEKCVEVVQISWRATEFFHAWAGADGLGRQW
jgi:hypothetical protein